MSDFDYKGFAAPRTSRGSLMVWMGALVVIVPAIVWVFKFLKGKFGGKPVGDALSGAANLSMAQVQAKIDELKEKAKKKSKGSRWGLWLLGILATLGSAGAAAWYLLKGKAVDQPNALYQLGFLGMPAPQGFETDRRYLAGVMKKQREDRLHDLASTVGARTLAGLPLKGLTAQFGKVYNNENYQQNSQWKNKL